MALREPADWSRFAALNGETYVTTDAEVPAGLALGPPRGLVVSLSASAAATEEAWRFIARRGDYRYDAQPDFFSSDLVEAYAVSRQRLGSRLVEQGREEEAARQLRLGWAMKWLMPDAPTFLAFGAFRRGRLEDAASAYAAAADLVEATLELARDYRSLPDVFRSARRGLADANLNFGVVLEKLGRREEALGRYQAALEADPKSAQAHYNLAVLHWDKDWDKVIAEMSEVLRLEPGRQDAARYLQAARMRKERAGR
jgi:tetratricopeptide (TPR) repeat protein